MINEILTHYTASISELKKQPMKVVKAAHGESLAILNHNEPVFYCVPTKLYMAMMEAIDDAYLAKLVAERQNEESFEVDINDL